MSGVNDLVQTFITEYKKTPPKLKVVIPQQSKAVPHWQVWRPG